MNTVIALSSALLTAIFVLTLVANPPTEEDLKFCKDLKKCHCDGCDGGPKPCPANETYNDCGSQCPPTCRNPLNVGVDCILSCASGCFCNEGLVRNRYDECVAIYHSDDNCDETCSDGKQIIY